MPLPLGSKVGARPPFAGTKFPLAFAPPLGAATASRRYNRSRASPTWQPVLAVNNVFGRAELRADTACCKYLGVLPSLTGCIKAAERYKLPVTSVTYHLPKEEGSEPNPWQGTCYAIVDGTWLPVRVRPGQAGADSARRAMSSLPLRLGGSSWNDGFVSESLWARPGAWAGLNSPGSWV